MKRKTNSKYFLRTLKHKWYVFLECCRLRIVWRGIIHDNSKFKPSEWVPYVKWFCDKPDPLDYPEEYKKVKAEFQIAWLFHQKRNPHHW